MLTRPEKSIVQETVLKLGHVTCDPVRKDAGRELHRHMQRYAKSTNGQYVPQALLALSFAAYSPELREVVDEFVRQNTNEVSVEMLRRLVDIQISEMETKDFELWLEHFEKLDSPFVVFGAYFFQVAVSQGLIIPQGVEGFERLDNRLGLVLECAQRYVPNMCAQSQFRSAMAKLHHLVVHGHLRGV